MSKTKKEIVCEICKQSFDGNELFPMAMIRPQIRELIASEGHEGSSEGFICHEDLNRFRTRYVERLLEKESGEVSQLESEVVESLRQHEVLSSNTDIEVEEDLTFAQRVSDRLAEIGGSWTFLIGFAVLLAVWILINSFILLSRPFDPYPFILLNLILSCLAAIQAPVIMMSQNRQEAKDRARAENDYQVNLKAELEIRHLHSKMDLLITHQWQRLLELQEIQMDMLEQFGSLARNGNHK